MTKFIMGIRDMEVDEKVKWIAGFVVVFVLMYVG